MTRTSKLLLGLAGVCALGLIWALADIVAHPSNQLAQAAGLSTPSLPEAPAPAQAIAPVSDSSPNWVFTMRANAKDDPESARFASASIVFEGTVLSCQDPLPRTQFGLAVDRTGESAAHSRREQRVCLPGCEGRPPAPTTGSLLRQLNLTAFQEQFDRAAGDYAPEGHIASVQWECGGRTSRLIAAATVALACNSEECDDVQVANAAVYLGVEHGRVLDELQALFVLRSVGGGFAVASASSNNTSR